MVDAFLGTVQAFGFYFAPRGWMTCQGQLLAVNSNTALFALLGTTFGGNGSTTFGLPNLQGRTVVGAGNSTFGNYVPGQASGNAQITLTSSQMPMHTHAATGGSASVSVNIPAYDDAGDKSIPAPNLVLATGTNLYSDQGGTTNLAPATGTVSNLNVAIGIAGGSQPVNIESPYLAMNYSICVQGLYPSRN